jgi:hypothetical protein
MLLSAKVYRYEKVRIEKKGSDYFAIDRITESKQEGSIIINGYKLHINSQVFKLRKSRKEKVYKAKGMMFRFTYANANLSVLQVYGFDKVYTYYIKQAS